MPAPPDTAAGPPAPGAGALAGRRLVLGVTGSIAAYKAADLARLLVKAGAEVQPVLTPAAGRFIPALTLSTLTGRAALTEVFPEGDAAGAWTRHVELGLWADGLVVAPATANTLARLAHGLCETMLDAVALSARCPLLVAPAMDHDMWNHPATQANVATLRARGATVVPPAHGPLASGLVGDGRLPEPADLARTIAAWLDEHARPRAANEHAGAPAPPETPAPASAGPLAGRTVLVTAGPTREPIDPVRFLSNGSTGTMGFALAAAAARRGARVILLAGPVGLATPPGVERIDVETADDLLAAALAHAEADLVIAAAAVADYAPAEPSAHKHKKRDDGSDLVLHLRRTPDVLATLGQQKRPGQTLVGFALETDDGEAHAREKLRRKRLDFIALNPAGQPGAGFGTGTNRVLLLGADGSREAFPTMEKAALAEALLDRVSAPLARPAAHG